MKNGLKTVLSIIKLIVIIVLMLILVITFIEVVNKIRTNTVIKNETLNEVYNNMKNLKNVKITRKANSLYDKYEFEYSYDVAKKWGKGVEKIEKRSSSSDEISSSEKSYYFVCDNNRYNYYYMDSWSDWISASFLDDYDYILKFLINTTKVVSNVDGSYTITIKDSLFNKYKSYYKASYSIDPFFPHNIYTPGFMESYDTKIIIVVNADKYITSVSLDNMPYTEVHSVSYSDFNNSDIEIPVGILAKLDNH